MKFSARGLQHISCHRWPLAMHLACIALLLCSSAAIPAAEPDPGTPATVIRAGGDFSYPPFEFLDEEGRVHGFNIDLLRAIGREQGLEIQAGLGAWTQQRANLMAGELDVLPMFISAGRDEHFDFTQPFLMVNHEIFIRKGGPTIENLSDLAGLEVIVELHAYSHDQLAINDYGARLITVRSEAEAMDLLASGKHDSAILGEIRGRRLLRETGYEHVTTSGPPILPAGYAFAVKEGNEQLRHALDRGLMKVKASGEFNRIYARWLGPDLDGQRWQRLLRLTGWIFVALAVIMVLAGLWLHALRAQVRARTRELSESEERFRKTFENAAVGLAWLSPSCRWVDVNPALAHMIGTTTDRLRQVSLRRLIGRSDLREFIRKSRDLVAGDKDTFFMECGFRRLDGQLGWAEIGVSILRERSGDIRGFIAVADDLTETQRLSAQLSFQQTHDSITGLLNRAELERRIQTVLRRGGHDEHVLLYMDLDQFKVVNEACGHEAGDELLGQVGHLLSSEVHEGDVLARLGGDEFAVLLENRGLDAGRILAEKLRVRLINASFSWQGQRFKLSTSIGMVAFHANVDLLGGVLGAADTACYVAKEEGGNRIHVFSSSDPQQGRLHGDVRWVARLNAAMEENRFELHAQDILPLKGNESGHHYEILLRLNESGGQLITPDEFMPAARHYYMMEDIDRWVVNATLSWLAAHPAHLDRLRLCAINLSGQSIGNPEFRAFLEHSLEQHAVPPEKLCFEITESAAVADINQAITFARRLKQRGCRFALDDFGIGMSSFAYLRSLPVDILKIDGMFVREMAAEELDQVIVESVARAARVLGKQSVAEYVENEESLERIRALGIDYAQGYAIDRPSPLEGKLERD